MIFKLEVTKEDDGLFTVRVGDRYADKLTWDEAIGSAARIIINGFGPPYGFLQTKEENAAYYKRLGVTPEGEPLAAEAAEKSGT